MHERRRPLRPAHELALDLDQVHRALEPAPEHALVEWTAQDQLAGALQFRQGELFREQVQRQRLVLHAAAQHIEGDLELLAVVEGEPMARLGGVRPFDGLRHK